MCLSNLFSKFDREAHSKLWQKVKSIEANANLFIFDLDVPLEVLVRG